MRCVSFCSTEAYRLNAIASFFRTQGHPIKQYRKVLHLSLGAKEQDIFIFSYGCLVTWGLNHGAEESLLRQLKQFTLNSFTKKEVSRFIYRYGAQTEMVTHAHFNVDIITLENQSTQLKLAISYGLAQSIQLESYESAVQKTIEQNAHYSEQLAKRGRIYLSQREISQRLGQIFLARSFINLNSDYLAVPKYFWEHPSLEDYYTMSEKFLDIPRRVAALNQKLDVLHEIFEMFTSQLQHRHSNLLEIIIIALIFIEIMITLTTIFLK